MIMAAVRRGEAETGRGSSEAAIDAEESEEENILYDLLVNTEWPPETEVQPRGNRKHGASFIITRAITGPALFLLRYLWYSPAKFSLPIGLVRLVSKQINWHLVLASNGKLLAAVQDQCIEIRSAKDEFGSVIGKCQVPKDPSPQWRRVAWSHDCTLLAYGESTGTVRVFDLVGSELLVISPGASFPGDMTYAIAGLIFLEYKASAQWSAELLVINYRGELKSYLVSVGTNQSFQESHSFNFSSHYVHGITAVIYHPAHRLLIVGGCEMDGEGSGASKASSCGLSAWRVLSGSPYYKPVTSYEDDIGTAKRRSLFKIRSLNFYSRQGREQDGVFKMSLSPDGTRLAAIHFSGKLTIWGIPSLRQQGEWEQSDQPGYDEIKPEWRLSLEKRKKIKDKESFYPMIDINWWSENAVILARCSGALTVSSVKTLKNLLGKSCEWFESSPQVTSAHDGGFLSLECEVKLAPKRSRLDSRPGDEDEGEDDSDSDDETSAKARYFGYLKQGLYFVTEMERFAPPRKRPRTIIKNYRLVNLRSTTPEELYQRKIDNEEYGEALSLAQTYDLDSDLVYQRQWRKSAVSIASIQDYLSKINKRSWVLHECLERVPENVDAAKELLQYGLKGTDLEALIAIGKGEDGGRFILPGDVDIDELLFEEFLTPEEEAESRKEREAMKRQELLQSVNFSKLTLEQKELCRSRLKLLTYLDRLATYEVDCALSLVRLGVERNIPGLHSLCDNLVTLETLVYETGCDITLNLKELQQMKDIEKLRLLMLNSSGERYVKNAYQWMVPFLHRCENESPGIANELLKEYLVTLAKEDLTFPLKIFEHSKPACQQKIISDQDLLMTIALDCIYSCQRDDQLSHCYDILECLPQRGYGPETDITNNLHDKVDELERILSVSEILEKHGLQKPVSFVKDTQDSPEEARKLMIRLTRHTGRKQPPVNETHWMGLLHDILEMQQNVYTCIQPDTCYEIFTESLLCSSRLENIHLAGQMMHCSVWSIDPPVSVASKGKPQYRVCYEKSIELVLAASREYFNSSTSLTDTCMDLARSCLQLITDCPPVVQEELDLIRALSYLEEFGVKILPLQVRLCSDRLSLIKECLRQLPTSYKQSAKLLGLANLLKVAGDDQMERKGQVLILLVEQALQFQDYKAANMHCQELMASGYSNSWEVCSQLGQAEGYQDMAVRQELIAYALTHCPPSAIEPLLAASSALQTEILYHTVNYQIRPPEKWESINTSRPASGMKTESSVEGQEFGDASKGSTGANKAVEKQGCHPFYESLIDDPYLADNEVTYTMYQHNPLESFAEVLLRTGKLAETKSEGHYLFPATEVLLQLASEALPNDMTLSLAYLLALPQVVDANKCFEKQSPSALSLQLASYYYSLQIYAHLAPCFRDKCHPLYRADPRELIQMVTEHVTQRSRADWPEEIATLIKHLQYYNERLLDFTQAQILQGLGKGVDVQRFTADAQYKRETILGLAETLEENVYRIALSLAQRYNVPLWEVYMTHLEFLFSDSGLSTTAIEERAQSLGLFETLNTIPEAFHEHMAKYVYPTIEGRDHQRLLYYFTLLENCACPEHGKLAIKPETHIRLLKKFKAVAPGLNYKKLTEDNVSPLEALDPVLTSQNILSISKLAPKIPEKDGRMLSASSVYAIWIKKLFWDGDPHLIKRTPETMAEWLHSYDICAKYFDRLHPGDIINFIDEITFSSKAVTKLSVDSRVEMTRKAIKSVKHIAEKAGKRSSEGDHAEDMPGRQITYEDALSHLQQSLAHLETLSHSFISSLKNSDQDILREYGHQYDLSRSEKEKINEQAVTMCIDGQPLDMIQKLLDVAVGDLGLSPSDIVRTAVNKVVGALSESGGQSPFKKDPFQILESIVSAVHASAENGENLVSSDDLLAWLRPFCGDDSLPVKPRIKVLQILEQAFHLSDEDSKLLVLFRTQAVLKACWPQTQVEITDIENEEKRYSLFLKLLGSSKDHGEFQHLVMLLQAWPPMKSANVAYPSNNPWVKLGTVMLTTSPQDQKENAGNEILKICRSLYETKHALSTECIKDLCLLLLDQSLLLPSLKLLLESRDQDLHSVALEQITAIAKADASSCDSELLSLLLDENLVADCISTVLYPHLINHLLAKQEEGRWDIEEMVKQLQGAGFVAEAGSLLMAYKGTHPALRTFGAALEAVRRWI
ncbi:neuroblastoma-amplified sequence isoform X1 [Podarcis lilfordi]|uniref:Neuroblastoma-amplified sequence isoform X1 n=1 Tax=Podarcis lilfordi TaxID=74358 RepID=A0AA35P1M7_9SAUR|nr:neuroblastoma-amplified sequence isoform X1 [Podarcis lilfordi]